MKNLFKSASENTSFKRNFIWQENQGSNESAAIKPTHAENIKQINSMVEKVLKELDTLDFPNVDNGSLSIKKETRSAKEAKNHMNQWTVSVEIKFTMDVPGDPYGKEVSINLGKKLGGDVFINIQEKERFDYTSYNLEYDKGQNKICQYKSLKESGSLTPIETSNHPEKTSIILNEIQRGFNSAYRQLHAVADNNAVKESDAEIDDLLSGLA